MKKLFLMIISGVCSILPLEKILACYHSDKYTHYYTYDDGTIGSTFISGKTVNQTCVSPGGGKDVDEYDSYGRRIKQTEYWNCSNGVCDTKYETEYDEAGRYIKETMFSCSGEDCSINEIRESVRDNNGYVTSATTYYCNNGTCYNGIYDPKDINTESYYYDSNGNLTGGYTDGSGICSGSWFECSGKTCTCENGETFSSEEYIKPQKTICLNDKTYANGSQCSACPNNAESCYLDDKNRMVTTCEGEYKEQNGNCVSSCGADYRDMGEWCNRIRWTPAEAAQVLRDDNTNEVTITFRK